MSLPVAGADTPEVSSEVKMLTTDVGVSEAQPFQVWKKQLATGTPVHVSKKPAGKSASKGQALQASLKLVPLDILSKGKLVSEEQTIQASKKLVPELVSSKGKLVRDEH